MKRFRRVLSILLSGAILCAAGLFSATAAEQEQPRPYTITYQAEEITDIDALLDLAVEQAQRKSMARGALSAPGQEEITVTQLLETRRYADGTEENFCKAASFLITETGEDGSVKKVSMSELAAARASGSDSNSRTELGIMASLIIYYRYTSYGPNYPSMFYVGVDKMVSSVARISGNTYVSGFEHRFSMRQDMFQVNFQAETINSPVMYRAYTMNARDTSMYLINVNRDVTDGCVASMDVYLSGVTRPMNLYTTVTCGV